MKVLIQLTLPIGDPSKKGMVTKRQTLKSRGHQRATAPLSSPEEI
jgi:hypothetical protein